LIPFLFALVYFGVIGGGVAGLLRSHDDTWAAWGGRTLLYGIGTVGLLGQVTGALGVPLDVRFFAALFALGAIALLLRRPDVPGRSTKEWSVVAVLILIPIGVLLADTVMSPLRDYDGRVTWMLKARAIAREHSITGPFFLGQGSRNAHSHYPLLIPVDAAALLEVTGEDDDHAARPVYALAAIGFLLALSAALGVHASRALALAIVASVAWLPQFAADGEGGMLSGYADISLIAFVSLALLSVLRREALARPIAFGLQLSFVACTKNEGLVFVVVLLGLALALEARLDRPTAARVGLVLLIAGVSIAALSWWRAQIPLQYDENYPRLLSSRIGTSLANYPRAARELLSRMLYFRSWGLFWPITVIAAAAALARREQRRLTVLLVAATACVLFVYITSYAVTNWTISELAVSSANRLLLHLVPFAAVLLSLGGGAHTRVAPAILPASISP
jgi:hypothetical protein